MLLISDKIFLMSITFIIKMACTCACTRMHTYIHTYTHALSPQASGIHIRQITHSHVTTITYNTLGLYITHYIHILDFSKAFDRPHISIYVYVWNWNTYLELLYNGLKIVKLGARGLRPRVPGFLKLLWFACQYVCVCVCVCLCVHSQGY